MRARHARQIRAGIVFARSHRRAHPAVRRVAALKFVRGASALTMRAYEEYQFRRFTD